MKTFESEKERLAYEKAVERVKKIKGFYWHLFWYVLINLISFGVTLNLNFDGTIGSFTTNQGYVWLLWGIGLAFHGFAVFGQGLLFGKEWEEKKIKDLMNK